MPPRTKACILIALRCCLALLAPRLLFGLAAFSSAALTASAVGLSMRFAAVAAAVTAVVAAVAAAAAAGLDSSNRCCSSASVFATGLTLLLCTATIAPAAAPPAPPAVVGVRATLSISVTALLLV
jgi:hypothetical protein